MQLAIVTDMVRWTTSVIKCRVNVTVERAPMAELAMSVNLVTGITRTANGATVMAFPSCATRRQATV